MRLFLLLLTLFLLVGCAREADRLSFDSQGGQAAEVTAAQEIIPKSKAPTQSVPEVETMPTLPNLGSAPELTNEVWLNSDRPLRLADLRGQVVLIDMWTFG